LKKGGKDKSVYEMDTSSLQEATLAAVMKRVVFLRRISRWETLDTLQERLPGARAIAFVRCGHVNMNCAVVVFATEEEAVTTCDKGCGCVGGCGRSDEYKCLSFTRDLEVVLKGLSCDWASTPNDWKRELKDIERELADAGQDLLEEFRAATGNKRAQTHLARLSAIVKGTCLLAEAGWRLQQKQKPVVTAQEDQGPSNGTAHVAVDTSRLLDQGPSKETADASTDAAELQQEEREDCLQSLLAVLQEHEADAKFKEKLSASEETVATQQKELTSIKEQLEASHREVARVQASTEEVRNELVEAKKDLEKYQAESDVAKKTTEDLRGEFDAAKKMHAAEKEKLRLRLDAANRFIADLKSQLVDARAECSASQGKLREVREKYERDMSEFCEEASKSKTEEDEREKQLGASGALNPEQPVVQEEPARKRKKRASSSYKCQ
jgi:hypothetical protein